jgi:hypothetical protein
MTAPRPPQPSERQPSRTPCPSPAPLTVGGACRQPYSGTAGGLAAGEVGQTVRPAGWMSSGPPSSQREYETLPKSRAAYTGSHLWRQLKAGYAGQFPKSPFQMISIHSSTAPLARQTHSRRVDDRRGRISHCSGKLDYHFVGRVCPWSGIRNKPARGSNPQTGNGELHTRHLHVRHRQCLSCRIGARGTYDLLLLWEIVSRLLSTSGVKTLALSDLCR